MMMDEFVDEGRFGFCCRRAFAAGRRRHRLACWQLQGPSLRPLYLTLSLPSTTHFNSKTFSTVMYALSFIALYCATFAVALPSVPPEQAPLAEAPINDKYL